MSGLSARTKTRKRPPGRLQRPSTRGKIWHCWAWRKTVTNKWRNEWKIMNASAPSKIFLPSDILWIALHVDFIFSPEVSPFLKKANIWKSSLFKKNPLLPPCIFATIITKIFGRHFQCMRHWARNWWYKITYNRLLLSLKAHNLLDGNGQLNIKLL